MRIEEELKKAMARREPPAGFTQRVMARAVTNRPVGRGAGWMAWLERSRAWRLAGAAAGISLALSGGFFYQQHERAERGLAAKRQLLVAVRIAGTKLQKAHRQVLQVEEVDR